jgi:predicted HTH transcriptional regulator
MANNLVNRDAYIIIGVSEIETGKRVTGVPVDNRKNQQNLIDFLKDKKFAGGVRPTTYVQTLQLGDSEVDVIIIKHTANAPYFLQEDFQGVFKGSIYTRIGDTNTPKTATADVLLSSENEPETAK